MDFPHNPIIAPTTITPFSWDSLGMHNPQSGQPTSAANTANLGRYYPFHLYSHATIYSLFYMVGTNSTGNFDVGIYDSQWNLLTSTGATALSSTNTLRVISIAALAIPPGDYWLAVSCSSGTGTAFRTATNTDENSMYALALYTQASAHPLPSTATPVKNSEASPSILLIGAVTDPNF